MSRDLVLVLALAAPLGACTGPEKGASQQQKKEKEAEPPQQPAPQKIEPATPQRTAEAPVAPPQPGGEFDVGAAVAPDRFGDRTQRTPPVRAAKRAKPTVKWTAKIGKTTFRTTMALVDGQVVIGTHGATLEGKNESSDGVYVLDAKTGKETRVIRTPGSGDRDVGGVAVDGTTIYFTADNAQIVAASLAGEVLWTAEASGKVRPAPALGDLDGDGALEVVVGDESGTLRALKSGDGAPLWTVKTGTSEYEARGYIGAVALADLDGDGRLDVVAGARDGILAAYRGKDGEVMWQQAGDSGIHASPQVADFDGDGKPEVLAAWSYGDLHVHDGATGALRWGTIVMQDESGIDGLFATPTPLPGKPGVIVAPTSWWGEKEDGVVGVGVDERTFRAYEGRTSASPVVMDLDGDGLQEAIVGTEKGLLLAFTADGGRAELARLRGPIEAPAMVADVDGNGALELLVADNDGILTCLNTGATQKPFLSRFRGDDLHNTGQLGKVALGWQSGRAGTTNAAKPSPTGPAVRLDYLRCCQSLVDAASRAPVPDNAKLLEASSKCSSLAAAGQPRETALAAVREAAGAAELPPACQ